MRRVLENIVVAIVASAVTWALGNPGISAGVADATIDYLLRMVAVHAGPLSGWLWLAGILAGVAGICLQVSWMAPRHPNSSWQLSLSMPSASTTLMGVGAALGVTAVAVGLAEAASLWALPLLALVVYWGSRWQAGVRYRWIRMASGL